MELSALCADATEKLTSEAPAARKKIVKKKLHIHKRLRRGSTRYLKPKLPQFHIIPSLKFSLLKLWNKQPKLFSCVVSQFSGVAYLQYENRKI